MLGQNTQLSVACCVSLGMHKCELKPLLSQLSKQFIFWNKPLLLEHNVTGLMGWPCYAVQHGSDNGFGWCQKLPKERSCLQYIFTVYGSHWCSLAMILSNILQAYELWRCLEKIQLLSKMYHMPPLNYAVWGADALQLQSMWMAPRFTKVLECSCRATGWCHSNTSVSVA